MDLPHLPNTLSKNPLPKIYPSENQNNQDAEAAQPIVTIGRRKAAKIYPGTKNESFLSSTLPKISRNRSLPFINVNPLELHPPTSEDSITIPNSPSPSGSFQKKMPEAIEDIKDGSHSSFENNKMLQKLQTLSKKSSMVPGSILKSKEEFAERKFPSIAERSIHLGTDQIDTQRQWSSQSLRPGSNDRTSRERSSVAFQIQVEKNPVNLTSLAAKNMQRRSALSIPIPAEDFSANDVKKGTLPAPSRARGSLTPRMSISRADGRLLDLHENSLDKSSLFFKPPQLENQYARECLNRNYLIVIRIISIFGAFSCLTFPGFLVDTKSWSDWTVMIISIVIYIVFAISTLPKLNTKTMTILESKMGTYFKVFLELGILSVLIVEIMDLPRNKEPWGSVAVITGLVTSLLPGIAAGFLHALFAVIVQLLFPILRSVVARQDHVSKLFTFFPFAIFLILVLPDIYRRDLERRQGYEKSKIVQRENRQLIIRQQEVDTLLELALPAHVAKILRLLSDGLIQRPVNEETPYSSLSLRVQSATVMFAEFHFLHQAKLDTNKSSRSMVNAMNFVFSKVDDYLQRVPTIEKIKTVGSKALFCLGLFEEAKTPLEMINLALYILDAFADGCKRLVEAGELQKDARMFIETKMGIETGPLVAGIVGTNKFVYDIYGDTVNTSSRCLTASEMGQIIATKNVMKATKQLVKYESMGTKYLKGKGEMELYKVIELFDHATIGVYRNTTDNERQPARQISAATVTKVYDSTESVSTPHSSLRDVISGLGEENIPPRIPAAAAASLTTTIANNNVKEELGRQLIIQLAQNTSNVRESVLKDARTLTDSFQTMNPLSLTFLFAELESEYMNFYVWATHKGILKANLVAVFIMIAFSIFVIFDTNMCCDMMASSGRLKLFPEKCTAENCLDVYGLYTLSFFGFTFPQSYTVDTFALWTTGMVLFVLLCSFASWYCAAKDIPLNFSENADKRTISEVLARITQPTNGFYSKYRVHIRIILYSLVYVAFILYIGGIVSFRNFDRYRGFAYVLFILVTGFGVSSSQGLSFRNVVIISTSLHLIVTLNFMVVQRIFIGKEPLTSTMVDLARFILAHFLILFTSWLQKRTLRDDFIIDIIADRQRSMTEGERRKSQNLLVTLFPLWVARWLESHPPDVPYPIERFESVTLLYSDIVGFTEICSSREPAHVITFLNKLFCGFDLICKDLGIEKITTIGDAYFGTCGGLLVDALPKIYGESHGVLVCRAAIRMEKLISGLNRTTFFQTVIGRNVNIRTGIHTGSVQGTVFGGAKKFRYDIIGRAVSLCEEVQTKSLEGKIMITRTTYELIKDESDFNLVERPNFAIDGMKCYFLESKKDDFEIENLIGEQQNDESIPLTTIFQRN
ncbi:hypothetical protein HK098_002352 [Nowakowskiella sp. JEL0407]|nr:hypothetical protein HK098_002352 [Nowakowskiella sp. JEL0407]